MHSLFAYKLKRVKLNRYKNMFQRMPCHTYRKLNTASTRTENRACIEYVLVMYDDNIHLCIYQS